MAKVRDAKRKTNPKAEFDWGDMIELPWEIFLPKNAARTQFEFV